MNYLQRVLSPAVMLASLVLLASVAAAQDVDAEESTSSADPAQQEEQPAPPVVAEPELAESVSSWSFEGRFEARYRYFLNDTSLLRTKDRNLMTLAALPKIDGQLGGGFRVRFLPLLMVDMLQGRLFRANIEEGYLAYETEALELRLGWDSVNWGSASTINTIDIINSRDLTEGLLDSSKIGQPMLRARFLYENHSLTMSLMAPFIPPRLPGVRSPFFLFPVPPPPLELGEVPEPPVAFGSEAERWAPQASARLSLNLSPVDLNASYFYGYTRNPLVNFSNGLLAYPMVHQASLDGQWLTGDWLLKWEVASLWFLPSRRLEGLGVELPGQRFNYLIGIERTFEEVFGNGRILASIELLGDSESVWFTRVRPPDDRIRFFQNHATILVNWSLENPVGSAFTLFSIMDLSRPTDHVGSLEYSQRILQGTTLHVGLNFAYFEPGSKLIALEQLAGPYVKFRLHY